MAALFVTMGIVIMLGIRDWIFPEYGAEKSGPK